VLLVWNVRNSDVPAAVPSLFQIVSVVPVLLVWAK
jgi:hypothetical protein